LIVFLVFFSPSCKPVGDVARDCYMEQPLRTDRHRRSVAYLGFGKWGAMASAGAQAYSGGLGAEPPAGSRGRAPGRGRG